MQGAILPILAIAVIGAPFQAEAGSRHASGSKPVHSASPRNHHAGAGAQSANERALIAAYAKQTQGSDPTANLNVPLWKPPARAY
jgi:hypothetical protein